MTERRIDSAMWDDPWFQTLQPDSKLLFIYLWSNSKVTPSGAYEISLRSIAFDTGLLPDSLPALLQGLSDKVEWLPGEGVIWVRNFIRRQSRSPKFLLAVAADLGKVKNKDLTSRILAYNKDTLSIPYPYPTDKVSIPYPKGIQQTKIETKIETETKTKTETETEIKPKNPPVSPRGGNTHEKVTPEFINSLVTEFSPQLGGDQNVRDIITDALNHKAIDKAKNQQVYLQRWLQRDVKKLKSGGLNGQRGNQPQQTRSPGPFANYGVSYGQAPPAPSPSGE